MGAEEILEKFIEIRCKVCNYFFFEIEENSVGKVRLACRKCKRKAKIRLSSQLKENSIYQKVADTTVAYI